MAKVPEPRRDWERLEKERRRETGMEKWIPEVVRREMATETLLLETEVEIETPESPARR